MDLEGEEGELPRLKLTVSHGFSQPGQWGSGTLTCGF
jgi:hypothetical protein